MSWDVGCKSGRVPCGRVRIRHASKLCFAVRRPCSKEFVLHSALAQCPLSVLRQALRGDAKHDVAIMRNARNGMAAGREIPAAGFEIHGNLKRFGGCEQKRIQSD